MTALLLLAALAIAAAALEAYLRRNRPARRLVKARPDHGRGWLDMPEHHAGRLARATDKGPKR